MNRRAKIGIVLCCLALCGGGMIVHRALDQRPAVVRPGELYQIVWRQIVAFREADYSRAYQQISSNFQEKFNVDAFADLARTDYPELLRAEHVEFGSVRAEGRHAVVQVYFFLPNGDVIPCIYSLIHEAGAWKIDGAQVRKRWPAGRRLGGMRT